MVEKKVLDTFKRVWYGTIKTNTVGKIQAFIYILLKCLSLIQSSYEHFNTRISGINLLYIALIWTIAQ